MKFRLLIAAMLIASWGGQVQADTEDVSSSVVGVATSGDQLVSIVRSALENHFGAGKVNLTTQEWGLVIDGEVVSYSQFRSVDLSKIKQLFITTDGMRTSYRKAIVDLVTTDFVDKSLAAASEG